MIRGRELIGMPVFSLEQGKEIGGVKNLIFDPVQRKITGLILKEGGLFREPEILPYGEIEAIGPDAILIRRREEESAIEPKMEIDKEDLKESFNLTGRKVVSEEGHDLGTIYDLDVNERTGEVFGFELTQGVFRDTSTGKKYLSYDHIQNIGEDAVIVDSEGVVEVLSQKGGLAKSYESIKESGSESLGKARETLQSVKESSVESMGKVREKSEALTLRAREKGEVISGRILERKETLGTTTQDRFAEIQLKSREGMERGKRKASRFWKNVSTELERGYEETKSYFGRLREQIENRRIEQALGRRVSRTILDPSDQVILHQGDIITHQAIMRAREIGALDSILNSVVRENRLFLSRKETESAGEELFSKRPPLPAQKGERLQKAG